MPTNPGASSALRGHRVLIVEDELLMAMELRQTLENEGCIVLGPAKNVTRALALLAEELPDVAVLDLNLDGELSVPVAAALTAAGVPFVVTSGYNKKQFMEPELQGVAWLNKPIQHKELVGLLQGILGQEQ